MIVLQAHHSNFSFLHHAYSFIRTYQSWCVCSNQRLEYSLAAHAPIVRQFCSVGMKSMLHSRKAEVETPLITHANINSDTNPSSLTSEKVI